MSRIGKKPVAIPGSVKVTLAEENLTVKGPKGELHIGLRPEVGVVVDDKAVHVECKRNDRDRRARAYWGMTRALIQNMVTGVTEGYKKTLEINGVGYGAKVEGSNIVLTLGFAHSVTRAIPADVNVTCPNATTIVIEGCDKQSVGKVASELRKLRPPEPYKGKGIKYNDEVIRRKAGKAFGSA